MVLTEVCDVPPRFRAAAPVPTCPLTEIVERGVSRHVHVVDLVGLQVRRVGLDDDGAAVDPVAHVHLLGDALEDGRQRLVDGVEADQAAAARVDVDVLLGVAGEREKQFLHRHLVHHHAVGGGLGSGLGRRSEGRGRGDRRQDALLLARRGHRLRADVPFGWRDRRLVGAACGRQQWRAAPGTRRTDSGATRQARRGAHGRI